MPDPWAQWIPGMAAEGGMAVKGWGQPAFVPGGGKGGKNNGKKNAKKGGKARDPTLNPFLDDNDDDKTPKRPTCLKCVMSEACYKKDTKVWHPKIGKGPCFGFQRKGGCPRERDGLPCPYDHVRVGRLAAEHYNYNRDKNRSQSPQGTKGGGKGKYIVACPFAQAKLPCTTVGCVVCKKNHYRRKQKTK